MPLLSGFAVPIECLLGVLRYPFAAVIHLPQLKLGLGNPLFGGLTEPSFGLLVVLRYPLTTLIHPAES